MERDNGNIVNSPLIIPVYTRSPYAVRCRIIFNCRNITITICEINKVFLVVKTVNFASLVLMMDYSVF